MLAVIGVLAIGVLIGSLAGYFGGWADSVLARITDIFFGIPLFLGALILLDRLRSAFCCGRCPALVVFGWMTAMRLVPLLGGVDPWVGLCAGRPGAGSLLRGGSCCVISCPTPLRRC